MSLAVEKRRKPWESFRTISMTEVVAWLCRNDPPDAGLPGSDGEDGDSDNVCALLALFEGPARRGEEAPVTAALTRENGGSS